MGVSDSGELLPLVMAISAARPQTHAPMDAARKVSVRCPKSAAQTPVSTSPIPPVAMPGWPVML